MVHWLCSLHLLNSSSELLPQIPLQNLFPAQASVHSAFAYAPRSEFRHQTTVERPAGNLHGAYLAEAYQLTLLQISCLPLISHPSLWSAFVGDPVLKVRVCSSSLSGPTATWLPDGLLWRAALKQHIAQACPGTTAAFASHCSGGIITQSPRTVTAANHLLNTELC